MNIAKGRRIVLSRHAQIVLAERKLSVEHVTDAVFDPDSIQPGPAVTLSSKRIGGPEGRMMRVAHRRVGDDIVIVTALIHRGAPP